ncbi:MAG: hypothetical protein R6V83_10575 [Candidatus Thorarchaeota archaeon]
MSRVDELWEQPEMRPTVADAMLAAGSSKSPAELADDLGFDISSKKFWQKGMKQFEEFIGMLEETVE